MAEYTRKYGNSTRNACSLQYFSGLSVPEALQQMIHRAESVLQCNLHSASVSLLDTVKRNFDTPKVGPKLKIISGESKQALPAQYQTCRPM